MGSIADKLAAKKAAALGSGGVLPTKAAASSFQTGATSSVSALTQALQDPKTPTKAGHSIMGQKRSVSALSAASLIPKKTSPDQVLFRCIKPSFNTVIAARGIPTKRIHFLNRHYLTAEKSVIDFLRDNAAHFGIEEVEDSKEVSK